MIIALVYLVMKLIWWDRFPAGMAPMLIGMLFLGSVQLDVYKRQIVRENIVLF